MDARLAAANARFCEETAEIKASVEKDLVELGGRLFKIEQFGMFAPNHDSFRDFLDDLKLKPAAASKLMRVWGRLVVELGLKPRQIVAAGGAYAAYEVLALCDSKGSAEDWLDKVAKLRRSDLRKEVTEAKTGVPMKECCHKQTETVTFEKCLHCGETWRVYDDADDGEGDK